MHFVVKAATVSNIDIAIANIRNYVWYECVDNEFV